MKVQMILLALVVGVQAQAQPYGEEYQSGDAAYTLPAAPKKKRVVQYDESTNEVVEVEPAPVVQSPRNPIVIQNYQKYQGYQGNAQRQIIEQPQTVVEASALSDSRAEAMRKRRQSMEVNTEQKIVEKLEEARMEDEKARAERLFGNGFGSGRNEAPVYQQPALEPVPVVVTPTPVQAVVPTPVAEEKSPVSIREEMKAALAEMKPVDERKDTYYISAQVGMAEYPDASNVKGNVATGLSVGMVTVDRIVIEGSFLYSDYEVEDYTQYYPFKDMTQYNFTGALKYQLLPGKLRPFAGGVVGYTYRKAMDRYWGGAANSGNEGTSNAFDLGLTAGLDIQLTDSFAVGGDFRYMTNVSYRRDDSWSNFYNGSMPGTSPVEELDYYTITLNGKFTF